SCRSMKPFFLFTQKRESSINILLTALPPKVRIHKNVTTNNYITARSHTSTTQKPNTKTSASLSITSNMPVILELFKKKTNRLITQNKDNPK
ncbi:14670_t:CDS:1, partial [Dentiscutata erythropus]